MLISEVIVYEKKITNELDLAGMGQAAKNWASDAGQSISDFGSGVKATVTGKENPQAAQRSPTAYSSFRKGMENPLQTADDAVRSMANAATFGYADKLAALGKSTNQGTNYNTELGKEYNLSAQAKERSPIASTTGEIAGDIVNPAFGAGMKLGSKFAQSAFQGAKGVQKLATVPASVATSVTGGVQADKLARKGLQTLDPVNPYLEEMSRLKNLVSYRI